MDLNHAVSVLDGGNSTNVPFQISRLDFCVLAIRNSLQVGVAMLGCIDLLYDQVPRPALSQQMEFFTVVMSRNSDRVSLLTPHLAGLTPTAVTPDLDHAATQHHEATINRLADSGSGDGISEPIQYVHLPLPPSEDLVRRSHLR